MLERAARACRTVAPPLATGNRRPRRFAATAAARQRRRAGRRSAAMPESATAGRRRSDAAPPPAPSIAAAAQIGFEERFGTRWVVWVGGMALALGGIFLVRYTIQQGLIGPGVRIMLGALLALGAGRRRRVDAAQGESVRTSRPAVGAHSKHSDRRRHHRGLCHRVRRLRALRISAAGTALSSCSASWRC